MLSTLHSPVGLSLYLSAMFLIAFSLSKVLVDAHFFHFPIPPFHTHSMPSACALVVILNKFKVRMRGIEVLRKELTSYSRKDGIAGVGHKRLLALIISLTEPATQEARAQETFSPYHLSDRACHIRKQKHRQSQIIYPGPSSRSCFFRRGICTVGHHLRPEGLALLLQSCYCPPLRCRIN
jgi:hypothetical protein